MAVSSFDAADLLRDVSEHRRSAVSRYYYSAYQVITAILLYEGQQPPEIEGVQRQSWNHEVTPDMIVHNLAGVIPRRDERVRVRGMLQELYKARVYADYASGQGLNNEDRLKRIRRDALYA